MSTKKLPQKERLDVPETDAPAPAKADAAASTKDDSQWHILYTPVWRAQLDLGTTRGLADAKKRAAHAIQDVVSQSYEWRSRHPNTDDLPEAALTWTQVSATQWNAAGHDGNVETHQVIVTLTRVA